MPQARYEITAEISGEYEIEDGCVTVYYNGKEKSTQTGGSTPEQIARTLLLELAREG